MSQTAVLVWLSAASALPTFHADLAAFAQSRLLRLEAPRESAGAFRGGATAYAPDVALQIEVLLEEARNATASLEQSHALSALEHAERLLRDHPELPQAAWLMAELLGLTADVESTAPDGANASLALRKRAAALEGPRAAPFSDHAAGADAVSLEPPARHALSADGLEPGDELEWDGEHAQAQLSTASGEHHVRVSRNGRLLWAGWVAVTDTDLRVRLPVPETPACSADDIGAGHFEGGRAVAAAHARCESYVLARAHAGSAAIGGGIDVALCERAVCGAVVQFHYVAPQAGAVPTAERGWPRWATYTAVAAAGVLATGLVLWRTGAFDRPEGHTTTNVIYMGQAKPMGFGFEKPMGFQF